MIRRSFSPTRRTMLSLTTTRPYHNYPTSRYETELWHEKFSHPFDSRDDPGTLTTENLVNLFPPHINTNFLGPSLCKRALLRFSHSCLVLRIYSNSSVDVYSIIFEHKAPHIIHSKSIIPCFAVIFSSDRQYLDNNGQSAEEEIEDCRILC